ncbi:hypothetical protein IY972_02315 [Campylobacter volucris]|uniref:hypothetical protein n=1 Tax=Campylobacter volucris TaxID=1031542 RepID=UPI0018A0231C|nr:hypothetical protein [Campylobacter volucris]MBF7049414.1 hypothetical protein [Campylobacter volucris]MBF7059749.1 hypothetical protein [Campylobacter volucris]
MSLKKNKDILKNILNENLLGLTKDGLVSRMLEQEVAGQRVFYVWLKQKGYNIDPENMDKNQSDGIIGNAIIECKLNENEGGGVKKAYQELYDIIPARLKQKGEKIPYYRIYVELQTFAVEVYDCHCNLVKKFDWYKNPNAFKKFFNDKKEIYEYDLMDYDVDLVEVIQNIYKVFNITTKIEAYEKLEKGIVGWFKPFNYKNKDINRLILNNDRMNEKYVQKMEGAFFTPPQYVRISTQYVLNAIEESKKDGYDDYVIIDRCVGVGNLESQFDESIYSHMILGTINEAEALTANIRFMDMAQVEVLDSLSQNGVKFYQKAIASYKKKNNVKNLAVIFLENPPYAQTNSNKDGGIKSAYQKTWVHTQMKTGGEDLDEQFCFSAFKYYKPYAYIHYGPIKIWKSRNLINKEVAECYLCNRKYFNASESAIALISWRNVDKYYNELHFNNDIDDDFVIKKVKNTISIFFDNDGKENSVCMIEARNFSFASPRLTGSINSNGKYGTKWVSEKNLLKVIPLFCACRDEVSENGYITDDFKDYRIIDTVYKTSDGGTAYQNDKEFLQDCLLYATCTHKNDCDNNSVFWKVADKLLDKKRKDSEIYQLYKWLCNETKINGLKSIEKYKKNEYGKLWREHNLYPKIIDLKAKLRVLHLENIRPKLLKYEILK